MHVGANPKQGTKSANRIPLQKYFHVSKGKLGRTEPTPKRTRATYAYKSSDPIYEHGSPSRKKAARGPWKSYVVGTKCTSEATPNRALRAQMESQTTTEITTCLEGKTRDGMAKLHNSVDKTRTQCPHPIRTPKLSRKENSLKRAKEIVVGMKYTSEPAQKQGAKRTQVRYNQYDNPYLSRRENVKRD